MATIGAIAAMRDSALKQLTAAVERISGAAGVEPVALPTFNRDPAYLHADQLRVLAAWASAVADVLQPEIVEPAEGVMYPLMTVSELKTLADERGVDLAGASRKADIIATLEAADEADTDDELDDETEDEPEEPADEAESDTAEDEPEVPVE